MRFQLPTALLCLFSTSIALSETPKDTLVVAFDAKPKSSDPRLIGGDANSQYLEELRFLPLVSFDSSGKIRFMAAEKIQPHGPTSFLITLRKGLKFANGQDMKADDVIATYNAILSPAAGGTPSPRKGAFDKLKELKKRSDLEIELVLSEPQAAFLQNLVIGILPKEAATSAKPEEVNGKGYESGPYVLVKNADDEWLLEKNAKFSHTVVGLNSPAIPKVSFKIIADPSTRYAAVMKGDIDIAQNAVDADKVVSIRKDNADKFTVQTRTALSTTFMAFNFKNTTLGNPKVRQAIAMAINRDEILQFSLQNLGEKAHGMFPTGFQFRDESLKEIPYNPDAALKILDEAGLKDPDGKGPMPRAKFTLKVPSNSKQRVDVAKAISMQLKLIGLEVNVETPESSVFSENLKTGNVDAWIAPWTGFKDADHLHFVFDSKMTPPNGANRGFYSNPKVDELLEKAQTTLDSSKRAPLYIEAQKILSEDMPYVYLWHGFNNAIVQKNVTGYQVYADGRYISLVDVVKK